MCPTSVARRPLAVAFDVNETLFSLAAVRTVMAAEGLPPEALDWWFARTLRDGFSLASVGGHAPFAELARQALVDVLPAYHVTPTHERCDAILGGLRSLDPHPDVAPALRRLRHEGIPVATLTNGSAELTEHLLRRSGLRELVDRCLSVDAVGVWKPRAEIYHYAAERMDVPAGRLALVAVHAWDCHGARLAGLVTGWASRLEGDTAAYFAPADIRAATLVEVVDGLLALPD